MNTIAFVSNLLGSTLFLVLTVLLLINWRRQLLGGLLILASTISFIWFSAITYNAAGGGIPIIWIKSFEITRSAAWLLFLFVILKQRPERNLSTRFKYLVPVLIAGLTITVLIVTHFVSQTGVVSIGSFPDLSVTYTASLLLALLGLLLVEQIYVSTLPRARWSIKFLCLGVGGIFIYDFFLYSEALLFNRINPEIWFVRGAINAMCIPLIAVAVARNPQWEMDIFVSRHVVYQSSATTIAGSYLILMAIAGYYIRLYGGTWGGALQILFIFGASLFLVIFVVSEQIRSKLKVFLAEHFYKNKYDYRQEWLNITHILAENKDDTGIYSSIIRAIADTMKCPGGALWLVQDANVFEKAESISFYDHLDDELVLSPELKSFILERQSIINLDDYRNSPDLIEDAELPAQITAGSDTWLLIGLINNGELMGFVILTHAHTDVRFNAEDVDLLKTVGNQIASYIALLKVTESLAEARQFEVFNRLSAFVVHDIKNLVAQLSLVTSNSIKFRNEPEFIDDVFSTIENSVAKMKKLLTSLEKGEILGASQKQRVAVKEIIDEVIKLRRNEFPVPTAGTIDPDLSLDIDKDKLLSVLEHLVQNAQDATAADGSVVIDAFNDNERVRIDVVDTGTGMDEDFIRNRLFKPFYTTKGNAGMGIGVYESREVIRAMQGNIKVLSKPDEGTKICIFLPGQEEI